MSTVPFSIRLDSTIKDSLDDEARLLDRSASYVAVEAIKKYVESRQAERLAIKAAVAKAEQGEFVSGKATREWFASLGTENELPRPKPDVFLKPE